LTGLTFNSEIEEKAIDIPGYNKVDPTSAKITVALEGNEINFYYTPRTDIEGIVNYYLKDTTTKLADSKPLTGLVYNSEITETAIEIAGYNKVDPTSVKITVGLEENEINFYYTPRTDLTGVVNYYLKDTTTKLADSKPLTGLTFNSEIEEKAIDIPGYNKVEPTSVTIKVGLEGNEINFYYTPRTDLTGVVNYYLKDTTTKLADSKELKGLEFNSEITENAIEIAGYNKVDPTSVTIKVALEGNEINFYYTPRTDLTGVVNYYLKDTTTKLADSKPLTGLTFNSEIEEKAIDIPGYNKVDPTSAKITVALEGNEINFYYTPRTDLTGIVNYYLKDTTTKLADSKELTGLTFNSEITEKAIDIPGYDKVDPTSAKITVALEGNEINFYYTFGKSQYTVEYYYEINGNYPSKTELNDVREGTTLSTVAVTADDKTPTLDGYIFDAEYTGNVLDGTVTPDGSLVLKVYFKQQLKVVYTKGSQGTFENQEYTVKYGDIPTTFNGTPTGNAGFHFVGWDKDVTKQVTENVTFIAIWEGLQVRKTRLEIIDKDNLGNTDYVDQDGDIIRYEITVKNIGDIKAENIVLKDSLAIKVVSVEIAGTEVEIANRGSNEFAANADLLQGLTAGIEPNETIVVTVEHTVTDSEVKAALANDSKIINIATAELNDNPYTGTDKTVDPEDGTEEEGTEVKQRCEYRVEYHYNGQLGTADDDVIESAAIVGATISFEKPVERKGFTYMNYVGSTTVTEGTNLIIVNYGKPVVAISKAASATVDAGANIEYTLTVTNTGLVGTTVTVSDELVGTTYVPGSANIGEPTIINNVLTWQVTVGAQSTKTITFKAATPKTAFGQTITNTAHIKNGETIIGSSNEVSTTVNEITVKYTEWKEGQQGTDLNIIFLLDNSASMNEPIAGEENEYSNDNSYYVAPTDVTKTRLYNAKEAIKGFITNQSSNPNTSMSVITFNSDYADTIDRYVLVKNEDIKTKTENGKTIRYTTINGIDYEVSDADDTITATDGNDYCYVTITINEGPVLVGTNSTSNADLTAAVNNITIGSRREGLGTSIAPAIDKITENSSTYLNSAKKNIVIVLADGDFDNPQNDSWLYGRGYVSAKNDLLAKDSNLEIYSVGFGNYVESTMRKVSTNDTCYPATNSSTILNKFNEILDEATGSEQTGTTSDGRITFNEATQTIKVSETCPIVATYETGAVDGEGNPIVETLFTCTSTADLATYGLTITGEKTISWDVKTFIANNPTAIVPNTVSIKYYIPITTSTN
ncbi:MAG: VWA domain-containing protein, partial [Clostridia bacterium]|nr:VWA domain-containing protein [Clostridia bacterium]